MPKVDPSEATAPGWVEPARYVEVVAAEGTRISQVARRGPLEARIPHMRRWRLIDVVAHLGGVHRWAAGIVSSRAWDGSGYRRGRETGEALLEWFDQGVEQLVEVLAGADLEAACPNPFPRSSNTIGLWARRQAHETTIHRCDAESATGAIGPIEAAFATDGIDELLHVFSRNRGGQVLDGAVSLACSDTGASWVVTPAAKPGRVDVNRGDGVGRVASVTGTAADLLLTMWHRRPLVASALTITGRTDTALGFLAGPVSP